MKRFLYDFAVFILPIVLLAYPLDRLFSDFYKKQNQQITSGEFEVWNDIYSGDLELDLALYGSSICAINFDNLLMEKQLGISTYNFGSYGNGVDIENLRHQVLMQNNEVPKRLIFSVEIYTLIRPDAVFIPQQLYPYMFGDTTYRSRLEGYPRFSFWDFYLPMYRYRGASRFLYSLARNPEPAQRVRGHSVYDPNTGFQFSTDSSRAEYDSLLTSSLEQVLTEMQDRGTKTAIVFSPFHSSLRAHVIKNRAILNLYQKIADSYDIPFLNYSIDSMGYHDEYFADGTHMRPEGATVFTVRLVADLDSLHFWE